jgi:hypothetical protein
MDPNACLLRYIAAALSGDRDEMYWANEDLSEWLAKGGLRPNRVASILLPERIPGRGEARCLRLR